MMSRAEILHHLEPEIARLIQLCHTEREAVIRGALGKPLAHAKSLWLLSSGEVASARTTLRDASGRCPLALLHYTRDAHDKLQRELELGYSLQELVARASPLKVTLDMNVRAWLLGGNHALLAQNLPLKNARALIEVPSQKLNHPLVDAAVVQERVKQMAKQCLAAPRFAYSP